MVPETIASVCRRVWHAVLGRRPRDFGACLDAAVRDDVVTLRVGALERMLTNGAPSGRGPDGADSQTSPLYRG